ncbi:MAG: glycoside hydrolase family 88 protein [Defluviitaleaceae bacterium]|nr:glycoside hydrolase family 88 protein [Defluviitaleaceae bacterium]
MKEIINFVNGLLAASTPSAPAWNLEYTLHGKKPKWNYVDGCMMKAIFDLYYVTGNRDYFDFAKGYMDYYIDGEGRLLGYDIYEYNCDHINMGKMLFDLHQATDDANHKEKYRNAIELQYTQLRSHPRIKVGNFWHKMIYPNQVWLDGLYMVQPFYMEYEMRFNGCRNYKDVFNQFKNVFEIMRDPATGLYFHGYDESREVFWSDRITGLSKNFWTRSLGWLAMALVDTTEKTNEQFFYEYITMQYYLKDLLDALLRYKCKETNLFFQVTDQGDREGNYLETSGSCAIAYALMKGARLGYLPVYYFEYGKEIFDAVVKHKLTLENGNFILKDICLVAGLGGMPGQGTYKERDGTFEYYVSEPRVNNDAKGVAPFLFAFSETIKNK